MNKLNTIFNEIEAEKCDYNLNQMYKHFHIKRNERESKCVLFYKFCKKWLIR